MSVLLRIRLHTRRGESVSSKRSRGSLYEVETQLELAESMGYLSVPSDIRDGLAEVGRMLTGFISKLHAH